MAWQKRIVTDQNVEFPNRFKIDGVSHTIEPDFGTIVEPGTPINKEYLQPIEDYLEIVATKDEVEQVSDELASHKAENAKFVADYEYQPATVVGTQIQVPKQSDTAIVKFRLDTDLSGGNITISLDAGATEKPLVDIENEPVTELDKGFVEVVENAVNFTYAPKGASLKFFGDFAESDTYGGTINALTQDNDYIYCGGGTRKVWKIRKSDMTKIAESAGYGGDILALTQDNDYVYCGGNNTQKVWKIRKSDMTKIAESADYGAIFALTQDNDYVYCGGSKVWKIRKSDMTKIVESAAYGGSIHALTQDNDYVYCDGGYSPQQAVKKIRKSDMTKIAESAAYEGYIRALTQDNDYVYCGGDNPQKVWKIRKSDMTKIAESADYGAIFALTQDNDYVYCGGSKVWKIRKSDMTKIVESAAYGGSIRALTQDNDYVYCGGGYDKKVWKLNTWLIAHYTYKDLVLIPLEVLS